VTLPNRISLARLLLIPVFVVLLQLYTPERPAFRLAALAVFVIAVASDGIDGLIARRYHLQTKLGAVLDPLADKLLINVAFIFLAVNPHLETPVPKWLPVIVLARDAFITGGAFLI
jgi:CDP-diacylglycerol--glycerol-3-phosphate 3-phosphatidyltransferase